MQTTTIGTRGIDIVRPWNPMQSASIGKLAEALSKAQGQITGALKDSSNPFFKSKYADLASCWDACRKQLADNGLAVLQTTKVGEHGLVLLTTIVHSSGEWMRGELPVKTKDDGPQAQGSGITYARRYALAAIVGLAQIDDDAEAAQGRQADNLKHDPKPPTCFVPNDRVVKEVEGIRSILAKDIDEDAQCLELFDVHTGLAKEPELYTAVADTLVAQKVLTKAQWKASIARGKELAHRSAA